MAKKRTPTKVGKIYVDVQELPEPEKGLGGPIPEKRKDISKFAAKLAAEDAERQEKRPKLK